MKMITTENNSLFRANEKQSRNWIKISAFSLLALSIVLLITFFILFITIRQFISYAKLTGDFSSIEVLLETYSQYLPEFFSTTIAESSASLLSGWIFYPLIFACVGFISFVSVTYVDGSMILENKSWLADLQEQGLINNFNAFKNLEIITKAGKIVISKNNMRYKIRLPKLEEHDLTRFGLVLEDNLLTCLCSKKELTGILHIFLSKVN